MDAKNIEDARKVLVVMKFAADALRRLHNESDQEEVEAAHAEHDAAKKMYLELWRS